MDFYEEGNDIIRISRSQMFFKIRVPKKIRNMHRKTHVLESHVFRPATLLKKRLLHRCFPVNILKFLRTPFFAENLWWLLFYYLIASRCLAYLAPQQLFDLA